MVKSVVKNETESVASFAALRPEDQEALARIFPWLGDLSAEKKEKVVTPEIINITNETTKAIFLLIIFKK